MLPIRILRTLELVKANAFADMLSLPSASFHNSHSWDTHSSRGLRTSAIVKLELVPNSPGSDSFFKPFLTKVRKLFGQQDPIMSQYFVIGVSGVTCGGKTSLTKLLQKKLNWAVVVHQDHYFRDDDWPHHVRTPEAENHVNYEVFQSLDMEKMYKDVAKILEDPPQFASPPPVSSPQSNGSDVLLGDKAETPNFDDRFLQQISDIDVDLSKYSKVPILIIEGFTVFGSEYLFEKCHARFFCTLDKETCRSRRLLRTYIPADSPSYFDKVIWPEYEKHVQESISKRPGITVFDGKTPMEKIWRDCTQIVTCRIEEKCREKVKDKRTDLFM